MREPTPTARMFAWQSTLHALGIRPQQLVGGRPLSASRRVLWLTFLAAFAFALASLGTAWWTAMWPQWWWFWGGVLLSAASAGELLSRRVRERRERSLERGAGLRRASVVGDETLAPTAARQPMPLGTSPFAHGPITLHRLRHPEALFFGNQAFIGGMLLFAGVEQLVTILLLSPSAPGPSWQNLLLGVTFIVEGLVVGGRMALLRRPFAVVADPRGLTWRRWGRRYVLPWAAARALCLLTPPDWGNGMALPPPPVYWIEGPDATLRWTPAPWRRDQRPADAIDGAARTAADDDPAWLLCRLVTSVTAQPLRDLTPAALDLMNALTRRERPRVTLSAGARWRRIARRLVDSSAQFRAVTSPVVVLALVGAVALVLQPRLYASRLTQAQASAPLLADSLSTKSGLWPVGREPNGAFAYADGGYTLTPGSTGIDAYAWAPPRFTDATVEVTVRQESDFDLSESGLVLRAGDATRMLLVFVVTPNGEWHLNRYRLDQSGLVTTHEQSLLYEGALVRVGAIHQGFHATNRLAVMMRDSSYAFFINGEFVGVYRGDGRASGHVGMYTFLSQRAVFTDFAVFRTPPPSPLMPV